MSTSDNELRQRKNDAPTADPASNTGRAPIGRPIFKLGIVSVSMAILPIGTYFGTLGHVFEETNTTAAAISAIVVTNIILIGYILTALFETDDDQKTKTDLQKKKNS
ncbi:hypothetical protein PSHT_12865 [Puccinia striiformis]|uniref:Uncharacterized protein n=1 Tax=Puccinia striiformis TaxID=27350 RepID=A0A2S4UU23_9BASI|nr:hypothetical protein PSHT_12865 [Puccinia striiformis]